MNQTFLAKKQEFDETYQNTNEYNCFLPVNLTQNKKNKFKKEK